MFLKKVLLIIVIYGITTARAQSGDFCDAIMTISHDAPNQFRNIRGNMLDRNPNATIWAAGIKVPGGISARFVSSMGLFYECAFFQTKNKEEIKLAYDRYKELLSACLLPQGYTLMQQPNFYPGLSEYKKLVYMAEVKEDVKAGAPSHFTLEAAYNKDAGLYTIVLFIFEH
jgi:hypothetical protein